MRQKGYQTKLREGKKDFLLLSKKKNDNTAWTKISPTIEPPNLPLFEVGELDPDIENKIKNDEKIRRETKIKNIKEYNTEGKHNDNQEEIQKMVLEYNDNDDLEDNISQSLLQ